MSEKQEDGEGVVSRALWNMNFFMTFGEVSSLNKCDAPFTWGPSHASLVSELSKEGSWGFDNEE